MGSGNVLPRRTFILGIAQLAPFLLLPTPLNPATYLQTAETKAPTDWEPPTPMEAAHLLGAPWFFTRSANEHGDTLMTLESDPRQFEGYDLPGVSLEGYSYNSCGLATIATIYKTMYFLQHGFSPDLTIWGVDQQLRGKIITDKEGHSIPILREGKVPLLYYSAIKAALDLLDPEQTLYRTENLLPDLGYNRSNLPGIYRKNWYELMEKSQEAIREGGMVILFGLKYNWGHFACMSGLQTNPDDPVLLLDSKDANIKKTPPLNFFVYDSNKAAPTVGYAVKIVPTSLPANKPNRVPQYATI